MIVVTDHSFYDYEWILEKSLLIVDMRNVMKDNNSSKL